MEVRCTKYSLHVCTFVSSYHKGSLILYISFSPFVNVT